MSNTKQNWKMKNHVESCFPNIVLCKYQLLLNRKGHPLSRFGQQLGIMQNFHIVYYKATPRGRVNLVILSKTTAEIWPALLVMK